MEAGGPVGTVDRVKSIALGLAAVLSLLAAACTDDSGPRALSDAVNQSTTETTAPKPLGDAVAGRRGPAPVQDLYVVEGTTGTAAADGGVHRLTIDVPDDDVLVFNDRPNRGAAHLTAADFVAEWDGLGFAADPPNAAITGTAADGTAVDVAVELTDPTWDAGTRQLAVSARTIGADRDIALPDRFEEVSLFIDSASSTITVNLTNPTDMSLLVIDSRSTADPEWEYQWWGCDEPPPMQAALSRYAPSPMTISCSNPRPGSPFSGEIDIVGSPVGGGDNRWSVQVGWDGSGTPSASVTKQSGAGVALAADPTAPVGVAVPLQETSGSGSSTPTYDVVFEAG